MPHGEEGQNCLTSKFTQLYKEKKCYFSFLHLYSSLHARLMSALDDLEPRSHFMVSGLSSGTMRTELKENESHRAFLRSLYKASGQY